MHRNTLVYRLEKIKKLTGLDLREFDDAIVFKVALMVKKYLPPTLPNIEPVPVQCFFSDGPAAAAHFYEIGYLRR